MADENDALFKAHGLGSADIVLVQYFKGAGAELAFLISGSFIIENLFSIPGIGRLFVNGVFARDYGLIMGSILFYAFAVASINLVVDILYAVIDPRIRYD